MTLTLLYWKEQVEVFEQAFLCDRTDSARRNCLKGLAYLADQIREALPHTADEVERDLERCRTLVCQKQQPLWVEQNAVEVSRHCKCNPFLPE